MVPHKLRRGPAAALSPPGDAGDDRQPKRARTAGRCTWLYSKDGKRDPTPWELNTEMTAFAHELKGIQALMAGDLGASGDDVRRATEVDMEIFPMRTSLHISEADNTYLFIRKHAKEVWDEVLHHKFKRSMVIGSPGIGKSVSSLYLLKKLLENNALVIYEERRDRKVYAFVPPGQDGNNQQYVAYSVEHFNMWNPESCSALEVAENYYLVDPGTDSNITSVIARTIVFPSPGPERLGAWRNTGVRWFYLGPWTEQEMLAVRPFICVDGHILDEGTVKANYKEFGGIMRYVYGTPDSQLDQRNKAQLVLKDKELVNEIYAKGANVIGTKDQNKPPSALFTLVPVEDADAASEFTKTHGGFRRFSEARVAIVSDWARTALVSQYWHDLGTTVKGRTHKNAVQVGWWFEEAAHLTLARGGEFKRKYLDKLDGKAKVHDFLTLKFREQVIVGGGLDTCLLAVKNKKYKGLYVRPMNPKLPLLDAAEGVTTELYQITIDADHKLAAGPLKRAVTTLCKGKQQLVINWVVPEDMFNTFKLRKVPDDLKTLVQQRVIQCRPEPVAE